MRSFRVLLELFFQTFVVSVLLGKVWLCCDKCVVPGILFLDIGLDEVNPSQNLQKVT